MNEANEHRKVGYEWAYSLSIERVIPVQGSRASARRKEKAYLAGNEDSFGEAKEALDLARGYIGRRLEAAQPEGEFSQV